MTFSTMRISDLALLCTFLGHAADPASRRWNGSLCFGKCARCGSDLVRGADSAWQVPRGYRIVWRPMPNEEPAPAPSSLMEWVEPEAAEPLEWEQPWQPAPDPAEPALPAAKDESKTDEEPVVEEHDEAPSMFEWPLRAPPVEQQADKPFAEPAAESVPAAEVQAPDATAIDDFMNDRADEVAWDEYPAFTQRTATG
jgi:hypothetical protein